MALWQFDCYIIPQNKETQNKSFDACIEWENQLVTQAIKSSLSSVLPPAKSWSSNIMQFGHLDGTCLELYVENNMVQEIRLRLDVRALQENQIHLLLSFAKSIGGKLYYGEKAYSPNEKVLIELVKNSQATKFVTNPAGYFNTKPNN